MTGAEVAILLAALQAAYRIEITDAMAALWLNTLRDVEYEIAAPAVELWMDEQEQFPTPAGIRSTIRAIRRNAEPARMAIPGGTSARAVPFPEGIQIAYQAYCHERARQGKLALPYEQFRGTPFMRRLADAEEARRRAEEANA